ncbi:MAG: hypothetical protein JWN51_449 [Phycisphaerales bacterium]|nr:hypothetical protein [Phycisphaerales bacterium]
MRNLQTPAPNHGIAALLQRDADDATEVTDIARGSSVMSGLLGAYQEQGYEQGYRRAVADVLAQLLLLTEQYLREQGSDAEDLRGRLYGFEAYVERHLQARGESGFVSGGLGI